MTPAERLERLLGRGAGEGESASLPVDAAPDGAAPSADLVELEAIAITLRRLDLPMSPERSAALRELLEAEAGDVSRGASYLSAALAGRDLDPSVVDHGSLAVSNTHGTSPHGTPARRHRCRDAGGRRGRRDPRDPC